MSNTIQIKRGSSVPTTSQLAEYELGFNTANNTLYINNGTEVIIPITRVGSITPSDITWGSQTAKYVFAAPNGSAGTPSFRALVASDIPNLAASKITSGTLAIARGGTGAATAAINTVFAGPSSGSTAAPSFRALVAADIPNLNASKITAGTLAIAQGGTAATTRKAAVDSLIYLGTNVETLLSSTTTADAGAYGHCISWFNNNSTDSKKPTNYGMLLQIASGTEISQVWMTHSDGAFYHRGMNNSNPPSTRNWHKFFDDSMTIPVANGGTGATSLDGAGIITKSGAQTFSGVKTFGAVPVIQANARYGGFQIRPTTYTGTITNYAPAGIFVDFGSTTTISNSQFYFRQWSPNSTANTDITEFHEDYLLPSTTAGRTGHGTYNILTSKTVKYGSGTANGNASTTISYGTTFSEVPIVIATHSRTGDNVSGDIGLIKIWGKTTSSFKVVLGGVSSSTAQPIDWIAIGTV